MAVTAICVAIAQTPAPQNPPQTTPTPPPEPPSLAVAWQVALNAAEEGQETPWLVPADARVIVAEPRAGLFAYHGADGRAAWTFKEPTTAPPVLAGENILFIGTNELRLLSQATGRQQFRVAFDGPATVAFSATDRIGVVVAGQMLAWDIQGESAWRAPLSGKAITNVVTSGPLLVVGTDEPALVAIDAATGSAAWKIALEATPSFLNATAERIYFGGSDGFLYAYLATGAPKHDWRFRLPRAIGQPIVVGDSVYFALLDNSIRAFGAKGGTQRFDQVVESRPLSGPLQLKDSIGVALTTGRVVELSPKDGKPIGPTSAMATGSLRLLRAAAAIDGTHLYTITIGRDLSRTLAAWARSSGAAR